jgi:hypothetical protein
VDVSADDLTATAARISAAALGCARLAATEHLLNTLQASGVTITGSAEALTDVLTRRDTTNPLFQALAPYEQRWALLVVRFADNANRDPHLVDRTAVDDARRRGVTWQTIADALGVTQQAAHGRYAARPATQPRRRRA